MQHSLNDKSFWEAERGYRITESDAMLCSCIIIFLELKNNSLWKSVNTFGQKVLSINMLNMELPMKM